MILKTFLLIVCTVLGGVVGWLISQRTIRKRKYFEQLVYLLNAISCDIKFRQPQLLYLLDESTPKTSVLRTNVDEFISYANGKSTELALSKQDLNEREYAFIKELFSTLGRYDLATQIEMLSVLRDKAAEFYDVAQREEKTKSVPARKLGLLVGLLFGIILM